MGILVAGSTISLKCLGTTDGARFLDGRTGDGTVGLAPMTAAPFTGARWEVIAEGRPNRFFLKCLGNVDGPRFLDGRTADGSVGLAPRTDGVFSGTHWEAADDGPERVLLKCLGSIDGPRFLDGRTADGTVGLAPATSGIFTGTHWETASAPLPRLMLHEITAPSHALQIFGDHFTPNQQAEIICDLHTDVPGEPHHFSQQILHQQIDVYGSFASEPVQINPRVLSWAEVQATDLATGLIAYKRLR
jgi:hypothetical protein